MVKRVTMPDGGAPEAEEGAEVGGAFASIMEEAREAHGEAPPPPPEVAARDAKTAAIDEARDVVQVVASLALPVVAWKWGHDVAGLYGAEAQERIAQALAAVAVKRGWTLESALGAWGPEIALAAALVGPAMPVLMARATAARSAPAVREEAAPEVPGEVPA